MSKNFFCSATILIMFSAGSLLRAYESSAHYGAGLAAMGGSAVALTSEDAVTVNPSVLAFLDQKTLLLSNTQSVENKKNYQALVMLPMKRAGWSLGYNRTSVSNIPMRDELNRDLGPTEFFSQRVTLGSGLSYKKILGIGATVNFSSFGLGNNTFENKTSFDLGLLGYIQDWNVGLSILGWNERKNSEIRCGLAKEGKRTIAGEIVWPLHYSPFFAFSLDYEFTSIFSGRMVFHTGPQKFDHFGIRSAISAGFRLKFRQFILDYGFCPEGDIGYSHKFSLIIKSRHTTERRAKLERIVIPKEKKNFILEDLQQEKLEKTPNSVPAQFNSEPITLIKKDNSENLSRDFALSDRPPRSSQTGEKSINLRSQQGARTFYQPNSSETNKIGEMAIPSLLSPPSSSGSQSKLFWKNFIQSAQSQFVVLSKEIEIETDKDLALFKLKSVSCLGGNRFSSQSGIILSHIAKLFKSYPELKVLIEYRGDINEADCAESIKNFLYNEKVESDIEVKFGPLRDSETEASVQILVFRDESAINNAKQFFDSTSHPLLKAFFNSAVSSTPPLKNDFVDDEASSNTLRRKESEGESVLTLKKDNESSSPSLNNFLREEAEMANRFCAKCNR